MLQKRVRRALGSPALPIVSWRLRTGIGMEVELLQDRGREGLKPLATLRSQSPTFSLRHFLSLRGRCIWKICESSGKCELAREQATRVRQEGSCLLGPRSLCGNKWYRAKGGRAGRGLAGAVGRWRGTYSSPACFISRA